MQRIVAGEDFNIADRLRTAAEIADEAARLAHQQAARSGVPRLKIGFPEPVEPSGGDPRKVERSGPEPADASDLRPDGFVNPAPSRGFAVPLVGMPVATSASPRLRRAETRNRADCSHAPALFSAQKVSSVIG